MPTKPSSVPTWDSNGTNITTITGGHASDGFATNEIPTSGEFNDFMRKTGQWCQYVSDALDAATTSYSLTASQDDWDPLGTALTTNLHTIYVTPDVDDWYIHGLKGGVDGREIDIINVGTKRFYIYDDEGTGTAANRIKLPTRATGSSSNLLVPEGGVVRIRYIGSASRWRVIGISGCRYIETLQISAGDAVTTGTGPTWAANGNGWTIGTSTGRLVYPVSLPNGATILGYNVYGYKISGAGTITARLYKYNANGATENALGSGATYSGSAGYHVFSESVTQAIATGSTFYFILLTGGGTTGDAAYHAEVIYSV